MDLYNTFDAILHNFMYDDKIKNMPDQALWEGGINFIDPFGGG